MWRKLCNEEFNNLSYSHNIVRVTNSRRMSWAGHLARMKERGKAYIGLLCKNRKEREHMGDPDVEGKIILRWIFRKWDVELWTGSGWLSIGKGGGYVNVVMNLWVPYTAGNFLTS